VSQNFKPISQIYSNLFSNYHFRKEVAQEAFIKLLAQPNHSDTMKLKLSSLVRAAASLSSGQIIAHLELLTKAKPYLNEEEFNDFYLPLAGKLQVFLETMSTHLLLLEPWDRDRVITNEIRNIDKFVDDISNGTPVVDPLFLHQTLIRIINHFTTHEERSKIRESLLSWLNTPAIYSSVIQCMRDLLEGMGTRERDEFIQNHLKERLHDIGADQSRLLAMDEAVIYGFSLDHLQPNEIRRLSLSLLNLYSETPDWTLPPALADLLPILFIKHFNIEERAQFINVLQRRMHILGDGQMHRNPIDLQIIKEISGYFNPEQREQFKTILSARLTAPDPDGDIVRKALLSNIADHTKEVIDTEAARITSEYSVEELQGPTLPHSNNQEDEQSDSQESEHVQLP